MTATPSCATAPPPSPDAVVRALAEQHEHESETRERLWQKGFTRRRLLAGGLGVGVATLGSQLVTTRVAYGAPAPGAPTGCLVVVFLRGGMDGLSLLVPGTDPDYLAARGSIAVAAGRLVAMDRGFGLHPAMSPLAPLVAAGKVAAVPAVSTPDLSRSHFQAQDCLERGGSATGAQTGWLDRVLEQTGPGTTFRAVALGGLSPRSLAGDGTAIDHRLVGFAHHPRRDRRDVARAHARRGVEAVHRGHRPGRPAGRARLRRGDGRGVDGRDADEHDLPERGLRGCAQGHRADHPLRRRRPGGVRRPRAAGTCTPGSARSTAATW